MPAYRPSTRVAIVYALVLMILLVAPLDPYDHGMHGLLKIAPYESTARMVQDIVQNFVGFAPFGLVLRRACRRSATATRGGFFAAVLTAATLALVMESIQSLVPGRYSSAIDVGLDTAAAAIGAALEPILRVRTAVSVASQAASHTRP